MKSYELYLPPRPRPKNDGRFKPGSAPKNKGRAWSEWMSPEGQEACRRGWRNIEEHRYRGGAPECLKKPVIRISTNGRWKTYPSIADAAAEIGGWSTNISRAIRTGGRYYDYYWIYADDKALFQAYVVEGRLKVSRRSHNRTKERAYRYGTHKDTDKRPQKHL